MKKPKPLEIKEDPALKARRRARQAIGPVKPTRLIVPKDMRAPKHKKDIREDDSL
ncbi:MAG: hypothetical protein IPP47_02800 [Bryobacterales bacterium]|nr:hypothetical protein [Bryobacterales bacterium]